MTESTIAKILSGIPPGRCITPPGKDNAMRDYEVEFHRELSERLRATRKILGISEREAADAAGVTVATYRKWERADTFGVQ
jgi:DNA-binding XRE family transcriptional regulator